MGDVLGQLSALGVAAALSTVPIMATIYILLSDNRERSAPPFLAGWVLGTVAALVLATLAAQALPDRRGQQSSVIGKLEIIAGIALLVLGIITMVRQSRGATGRQPSRIQRIGGVRSLPAFGIGLALNVRPKAILLVVTAGLVIGAAHLRYDGILLVIVVYSAIATSTVAGPILASRIFPRWFEPRLVAARDWLTAHGGEVTAVTLMLIGVFVIVLGAT